MWFKSLMNGWKYICRPQDVFAELWKNNSLDKLLQCLNFKIINFIKLVEVAAPDSLNCQMSFCMLSFYLTFFLIPTCRSLLLIMAEMGFVDTSSPPSYSSVLLSPLMSLQTTKDQDNVVWGTRRPRVEEVSRRFISIQRNHAAQQSAMDCFFFKEEAVLLWHFKVCMLFNKHHSLRYGIGGNVWAD